MRVLVVTARKTVPPDLHSQVLREAQAPHGVVLDLLSVAPAGDVDGFRTVYQPTSQSGRPIRVLRGDPSPVSAPARRSGLLRRRKRSAPAPEPASTSKKRVPRSRRLAVACRTAPDLPDLASAYDGIVAVDAKACLGLWQLAQRVPDVPMVFGADHLGRTLWGSVAASATEPSVEHEAGVTSVATEDRLPAPPPARHRLLIAPANYAGQGHAWADAVNEHVPDAAAMNFRAGNLRNPFPTHYQVDTDTFRGDVDWRIAWRDHVMASFTHVVVEANRPIFGEINGRGEQSVKELLAAGKQVALLSHGTDARIPSVHAARERWHPYDAINPKQLQVMESNARANVAFYDAFAGPVFVSTPGLLAFVRRGRWLPLVIDLDAWASEAPLLAGRLPVVAHIPSGPQKGSHMIDPILTSMAGRGLIEYRRVEGVPYSRMPELYGTSDLVVEQFGIADYSAAACEAMAAGRVVVSRVADEVRAHVRSETGWELPVVEADPETLEQVILELVADPDRTRSIGAQGLEFVRSVHDGRQSARILQRWLDETTPPTPETEVDFP